MYEDWIDEIMSAKTLPEYIYSPFPKPPKQIHSNGIFINKTDDDQHGNHAERPKFMTSIAMLIAVIISMFSNWM